MALVEEVAVQFAQIPREWREETARMLTSGEASEEFWAFVDSNDELGAVIERLFRLLDGEFAVLDLRTQGTIP